MGKLILKDGKYAKNDKRAGCNKQAGWSKMAETNKRSEWKKCNQGGGKIQNVKARACFHLILESMLQSTPLLIVKEKLSKNMRQSQSFDR